MHYNLRERFWDKVILAENDFDCWIWGGAHTVHPTHEYGLITINYRNRRAHRISYELEIGPIPQGLEIDHLCRNTMCVNPYHLEAVTHKVNQSRMIRTAPGKRKSKCKRGHEFDKVVVNKYGRSYQKCSKCMSILNAKRYKKSGEEF